MITAPQEAIVFKVPSCRTVSRLGHESRLLVFTFGGLGNVHWLVARRLQTAVMPKRKVAVQAVIIFG